jgi:hypothetical protein
MKLFDMETAGDTNWRHKQLAGAAGDTNWRHKQLAGAAGDTNWRHKQLAAGDTPYSNAESGAEKHLKTYPDFLTEFLRLEVPVCTHLLPYLDPQTLSNIELVSQDCLKNVRLRGYWKTVILNLLKADKKESRILER